MLDRLTSLVKTNPNLPAIQVGRVQLDPRRISLISGVVRYKTPSLGSVSALIFLHCGGNWRRAGLREMLKQIIIGRLPVKVSDEKRHARRQLFFFTATLLSILVG